MKKSFVIAVALAALGALPAGASTLEAKVRVGDLDLNSSAGAAVLYRRIERAAARVCVELETDRSLTGKRVYEGCVDDVISRAVATVHRPQVSDHAAARFVKKQRGNVRLARE